jgi:CysZ protein
VSVADDLRTRPGVLRRSAAGAWHVPAGLWFLLRRPRLWPLALAPAVVTAVCLVLGLFLGVYLIGSVEKPFQRLVDSRSELLGALITTTLWIGTLATGLVLGLAAALLLSSPLLDQLSRRAERLASGAIADDGRGLRWEIGQAVGASLYLLAAAPLVFLLSLIPLVGPVIALLWGAWVLALQETDSALTRRGLDLRARKAWHRFWQAESVGFGVAGLLLLPLTSVLAGPVLTIGGTLLVLELEQHGTGPERASQA